MQIVIGILLAASITSWAIIFRKRMVVRRAQRDADRFESSFWSGGDLSSLLYRAIESRGGATGIESIFEFGFREFARLRAQGGVAADMLLEGSRRAMRVAQLKETERLEHNLATLATVGSTSPYVGLFGTVWGIMSAFSASRQCAAGHAGDGGSGHCRGTHRHGLRPVRGDPGSGCLQPLRRSS